MSEDERNIEGNLNMLLRIWRRATNSTTGGQPSPAVMAQLIDTAAKLTIGT